MWPRAAEDGHCQAEGAASPMLRLLRGPRPPQRVQGSWESTARRWVPLLCFAASGPEPICRCLLTRFPEGCDEAQAWTPSGSYLVRILGWGSY